MFNSNTINKTIKKKMTNTNKNAVVTKKQQLKEAIKSQAKEIEKLKVALSIAEKTTKTKALRVLEKENSDYFILKLTKTQIDNIILKVVTEEELLSSRTYKFKNMNQYLKMIENNAEDYLKHCQKVFKKDKFTTTEFNEQFTKDLNLFVELNK